MTKLHEYTVEICKLYLIIDQVNHSMLQHLWWFWCLTHADIWHQLGSITWSQWNAIIHCLWKHLRMHGVLPSLSHMWTHVWNQQKQVYKSQVNNNSSNVLNVTALTLTLLVCSVIHNCSFFSIFIYSNYIQHITNFDIIDVTDARLR